MRHGKIQYSEYFKNANKKVIFQNLHIQLLQCFDIGLKFNNLFIYLTSDSVQISRLCVLLNSLNNSDYKLNKSTKYGLHIIWFILSILLKLSENSIILSTYSFNHQPNQMTCTKFKKRKNTQVYKFLHLSLEVLEAPYYIKTHLRFSFTSKIEKKRIIINGLFLLQNEIQTHSSNVIIVYLAKNSSLLLYIGIGWVSIKFLLILDIRCWMWKIYYYHICLFISFSFYVASKFYPSLFACNAVICNFRSS